MIFVNISLYVVLSRCGFDVAEIRAKFRSLKNTCYEHRIGSFTIVNIGCSVDKNKDFSSQANQSRRFQICRFFQDAVEATAFYLENLHPKLHSTKFRALMMT